MAIDSLTAGCNTVFHKRGRHHTRGDISVRSQPIFKILSLADFPVNLQ